MPNSYFKFKQFTIQQERCAMKVCTDACLFGAWIAASFKHNQPRKILDIGTGTGLLPLMLAQKLTGFIDTIEIDKQAYSQATENISVSSWKENISAINADVKAYNFSYSYDLIISNPPFYEHDLRSPDTASNMAKHDESLTLQALLSVAKKNLSPHGSLALLIPYHRSSYLVQTAGEFGLHPSNVVSVRQTTKHSLFRSMIIFKTNDSESVVETEISIKEGNGYTAEFAALLQEYYLCF